MTAKVQCAIQITHCIKSLILSSLGTPPHIPYVANIMFDMALIACRPHSSARRCWLPPYGSHLPVVADLRVKRLPDCRSGLSWSLTRGYLGPGHNVWVRCQGATYTSHTIASNFKCGANCRNIQIFLLIKARLCWMYLWWGLKGQQLFV